MTPSPYHTASSQRTPKHDYWRGLRFFNAYRLVVATLLLGIHAFLQAKQSPELLTLHDMDIFSIFAAIYAILALLLLATDELRLGRFSPRLQIGLVLDLIFLGLLGALDGSPVNNLHILMVISMAYASLLLGGRDSVAYAALGSLLLLGMNFWDHWLGIDLNVSFTHAGLNGMALFAVAILASNLAQRATSNQQLAEQRGIDLANETQLNRLILEQSHEGVIVIDAQHCIRHANPAAIRLLRLPHESNSESSRDSKFGRPPLARVNPDLNAALLAWRDAPDDALSETHVAYPMRLHARIRPLTDDPQGPVALFVEDDAYLREKLQQEKLAAMGRLTASIAHEIRNPLSAIGQAGQLLEESAQNAQDQQLLGIVRSQVARINQLVESVLTTAKRKQARPEVVHLAPWLHELIERYTSYTNLDGARIDLTVAPSLSARVDPRHLEQILVILLDNARQHGKPALGKQRIRIDVHTFGTENRPRIEVRDNGSGIAPEMRHRLFEPFFSTHAQGHGLGLFIARELAEANQLVLNYHHEVQGDRCFRLTFPRQELCHEVPPKKVEPKILEPAKQ